MRLEGKTALVTGGGAGIGRALAIGSAREGAAVVVVDIDAQGGTETVAAIEGAGGRAIFVQADVAQSEQVQAMARQAVDAYGFVNVLFNNAGIQPHDSDGRAHELSEEVWDRVHGINLRGAWLVAKYVLPSMLAHGSGSIVVTASPIGGILGVAQGYTGYSSSKAGLLGLTRTMAAGYARDNIRVNAVVPGTTETPLIKELLADEQWRQALTAASPLGRIGKPEDVVGLGVFLASDEAAYCTGGIYMADGGLTMV